MVGRVVLIIGFGLLFAAIATVPDWILAEKLAACGATTLVAAVVFVIEDVVYLNRKRNKW